jgi:hypothetical protein
MNAEPYLDQLIDALQQLRARVIQVTAGQHSKDGLPAVDLDSAQRLELDQSFIRARIIFLRLDSGRTQVGGADLTTPEGLKKMEQTRALEEQNMALGLALDAIHTDYSVETIDAAIRLAASQRVLASASTSRVQQPQGVTWAGAAAALLALCGGGCSW